jgi:flagellar motility protein MotE (MotC chaperone)
MKFRLLPVAIIALVLTLGIKLGGVWTDVIGAGTRPSLAQQAPAQPQAAAPKEAAEKATPKDAASQDASKDAPKDAKKTAEKPAAPVKKPGSLPDDPALLSQAEIDLLQKLAARRNEIEKWAQELEMREGLLKAAEQRIDRKVGELRQIQTKIQGMLRQYDKEQEDKLKSLVKIYETMKPKEAARIFMELDMPVLLDVIERMKEAKAALIISKLEPEKAKRLTTDLAKRRKIGADAKAKLPSAAPTQAAGGGNG